MILYMNRRDVPEAEQGVLSSAVIDYVVGRANEYARRCRALYGRYIGVPQIHRGEDENDVRAEANYAKYIVDIIRGYFLSEPVKYDCNDKDKKDSQAKLSLVSTVEAKLDRQSSRDAALEKLQKIVDTSDKSAAAHKEAAQKIAKISDGINAENRIETLVTAKGVGQCLAIVSTDGKKVDVIVDSKDLSDALILQIKEIAVEQVGCDYKNVTIIQSK